MTSDETRFIDFVNKRLPLIKSEAGTLEDFVVRVSSLKNAYAMNIKSQALKDSPVPEEIIDYYTAES